MRKKLIAALAACAAAFLAPAALADWRYDEKADKMSGKTLKTATLSSNNSLDLDFPYKGRNYAHLTVRQHPKHGLDVMLQIDKGQILCSSYSGCPIEVRFDDAKAVRFGGLEPADHSSTYVFFDNAKRFISSAQKAKRILVQVNIYQSGAPVMEFHSAQPLAWGAAAPSAKLK